MGPRNINLIGLFNSSDKYFSTKRAAILVFWTMMNIFEYWYCYFVGQWNYYDRPKYFNCLLATYMKKTAIFRLFEGYFRGQNRTLNETYFWKSDSRSPKNFVMVWSSISFFSILLRRSSHSVEMVSNFVVRLFRLPETRRMKWNVKGVAKGIYTITLSTHQARDQKKVHHHPFKKGTIKKNPLFHTALERAEPGDIHPFRFIL